MSVRRFTTPVQKYAKIAGVLLLLSLVAGTFGEIYVPSSITVSSNATETAHNIVTSQTLYRLGFVAYLLELVCDISLALIFYVLLKPVNRNLALLGAFFRLVSSAAFAIAAFFYFSAPLILSNAAALSAFSPAQLDALALLALKFYGGGDAVSFLLYGLGSVAFGYLIFRSVYLPKFLGVLLALGGAGFILSDIAQVLAPSFAAAFLALPMFVAMLALMVWFIVKGVNIAQWERRI